MQTVLVVDDQPDLCDLMVKLLRLYGYKAACVTEGILALEYVRSQPTGLVILDVTMPGMDGFDVLRELRADPKTASIPVVMHTAMGDPASRERAATMGADGYLLKGKVELDELQRVVEQYVGPGSVSPQRA
jgi:CheY-like chemotaxis protein